MTLTSTSRRTLIIIASALWVALVAIVLSRYVFVDFFPSLHTYGVDVGSSTHYCYADIVRWHLTAGCERAR